MNQKMLDEKFDRKQTSSNIVQHDFFLFSFFFKVLKALKCIQHFIQHRKFSMLDAFAPALIKVIFHAIFCLISKLVTLGKKIFDSALASLNITYQVEEDPYNKVWHRSNFLTWPQIMEPYSK